MEKFLYENHGLYQNLFDVTSIQFALHYMFSDNASLHNFMRNISKHTKQGGYFIGTCFDGERVFQILKSKSYNEPYGLFNEDKSRKIWHVSKKYNDEDMTTLPMDETCVGMKIEVYQESINRTFDEYLVNFKYLIHVMKDYGFQPVSTLQVDGKEIPGIGEFEIMDRELNNRYEMSENEKIISYLNNYFVFKKVEKPSDISIERVYNMYLKIENDRQNNSISYPDKIGKKVVLN